MLVLAVVACVAALALASASANASAPRRRAERHVDDKSVERASRAVGAPGPDLTRLERAIDALAIEVERVGENQRFITKLLAEESPTKKG